MPGNILPGFTPAPTSPPSSMMTHIFGMLGNAIANMGTMGEHDNPGTNAQYWGAQASSLNPLHPSNIPGLLSMLIPGGKGIKGGATDAQAGLLNAIQSSSHQNYGIEGPPEFSLTPSSRHLIQHTGSPMAEHADSTPNLFYAHNPLKALLQKDSTLTGVGDSAGYNGGEKVLGRAVVQGATRKSPGTNISLMQNLMNDPALKQELLRMAIQRRN